VDPSPHFLKLKCDSISVYALFFRKVGFCVLQRWKTDLKLRFFLASAHIRSTIGLCQDAQFDSPKTPPPENEGVLVLE
jgi:hypothetical protein